MITKIKFPRELVEPVGLKEVGLHGLRPVVVLAGPNGAGKSRYLKLVEQIVSRFHELLGQRQELQEELKSQGTIKLWETSSESNPKEHLAQLFTGKRIRQRSIGGSTVRFGRDG